MNVEHIEAISRIRLRNNGLWMGILEIALKHAPDETKRVLAIIRDNDLKITAVTQKIIEDED